jgi:hypothetical protein
MAELNSRKKTEKSPFYEEKDLARKTPELENMLYSF